MRRVAIAAFAVTLTAAALPVQAAVIPPGFAPGITTRVSVNSDGAPVGVANGLVISANGRYVVFVTSSTNVVPGVTGPQVYRHDRTTGVTELVSVDRDGHGTSGASGPTSSADGRYIAYSSLDANIVPDDTNNAPDVFLRDMGTGLTSLVSSTPSGGIADRGGFLSGRIAANSISHDGTYVVFGSASTNLVAEPANGFNQIYRKDTQTGAVLRVSVDDTGNPGNDLSSGAAISGNGRVIAFVSQASNFSPLVTNHSGQVYVHDVDTGLTTVEAVNSEGAPVPFFASINPALSIEGRYLAFETQASMDARDLDFFTWDVYLRDRTAATTKVASLSANTFTFADSRGPTISSDGRYVGFHSVDSGLVSGDANNQGDVFLYDRDTENITLVSLNDAGQQATGGSSTPSLSSDGTLVLFTSVASNFVTNPPSTGAQLYVRAFTTNAPPAVAMPISAVTTEGVELVLNGSFTDADAQQSWTATADFGDGSNEPVALAPDKTFMVAHTYESAGTFSLVVTVTDSAGASGSATTSVEVGEATSDPVGGSFGGDPTTGISIAEPVNTFSGNFTLNVVDVQVPARGLPLLLARTFNARDTHSGVFGPGWTSGLEWAIGERVTTATITRGDGRRDIYVRNADGTYAPPSGVFDTLVKRADGTFALSTPGQITVEFTAAGTLRRIADRDGDALTFATDTSGRVTSVTDGIGRSLVFRHDASGDLIAATDPAGREFAYAYESGRLASATDATGATTRYAYDVQGRITQITDPLGNVTLRNEYDSESRVTRQTDAVGGVMRFIYDEATRTTTYVDARGNATRITHDTAGRALSVTDALGRAITYTYDARGNRTSFRDRSGNLWQFDFDDRGNRIGEADPAGGTSAFTYDALNDMLTRTDPNGHTWRYEYDPRGNLTKVVDPEGGMTRLEVDASGLPTKITDADGVLTTLTYDASGNPTSIRNAAGVTESRYDAVGRLIGRTDANGRDTTFAYDGQSRLLRTTDARGDAILFTYDAAGNLVSITDRLGATTLFIYDAARRMLSAADALGQTTTFTYDLTGNRTIVTDPAGKTARLAYDELDRLVAVTDAEGGILRLAYDPNGNLVSTTDARGNVASFDHNFRGQRTSALDRVGGRTTYGYDAAGRLVSITNPLGAATQLAYDRADRYIATTDALGNATRIAYTLAGRRSSITDAKGNVTRLAYDTTGRLGTTTDAIGGQTSLTYDSVGNVLTRSDPLGRITTFGYDPLDRLDSVLDALGNRSLMSYDANGALSRLTDANGHTTTYLRDLVGRLTQVTDAVGGVTRYEYDVRGLMTRLTDANGHAGAYAYDGNGRLVTETDALGRARSLRYDANGNPVDVTDAKGQRTSLVYDAEDRLIRVGYADGTSVTSARNAAGDRLQMVDALGTTAYSYDAMRRLTSVTDPFGKIVRYGYDANGLRSSLTYPDGHIATYSYDALNRPVTVGFEGATSASYGYDAVGNAVSATFANGSRSQASYDALDRVLSLTNRDGEGKTASTFNYAYDAIGNMASERADGPRDLSEQRSYTYDALSRLISISERDQNTTRYSYDSAGNRTGVSTKADPDGIRAVFDAVDQLNSLRRQDGSIVESFAYDANGNMVGRTKAGATTSFAYDAADRLVGAGTPASQASFSYNGDGQLLRETRTNGGTSTLTYALDVSGALAQMLTASDGNDTVSYVYGLERIASLGAETRYYGQDVRGSVRTTTDERGKLKDSQTYDAWGTPHDQSGSDAKLAGLVGFTGERQDAKLGLEYLRARWYAPDIGRFLSRDPFPGTATEPRSLSPYAYAENNPTSLRDPSGLSTDSMFDKSLSFILVPDPCTGMLIAIPDLTDAAAKVLFGQNQSPSLLQGFLPSLVCNEKSYVKRAAPLASAACPATSPIPAQSGPVHISLGPTGQASLLFAPSPSAGDSCTAQAKLDMAFYGKAAGQAPKPATGEAKRPLPVLVIDARKMPNIAKNIRDALREGYPETLTRETDPAVIKANRAEACAGFAGCLSPDEYPFASTREGGTGARVTGVPIEEQLRQGGVLRAFYRLYGLKAGDKFRVILIGLPP